MLIPNKARHKTNAERLIDYYYEPRSPPNSPPTSTTCVRSTGSSPTSRRSTRSAADNPLIIPDAAMAAKSHAFRSLSQKEETAYEEKFAKLIGA